jgi:hypothetical protein
MQTVKWHYQYRNVQDVMDKDLLPVEREDDGTTIKDWNKGIVAHAYTQSNNLLIG